MTTTNNNTDLGNLWEQKYRWDRTAFEQRCEGWAVSTEVARAIMERAVDERTADALWEDPEVLGVFGDIMQRAIELRSHPDDPLYWGASGRVA